MHPKATPRPQYLQVVNNDIDHDEEIEAERPPPFVVTSSWPNAADVSPRNWIYDRHYLLGSVSATVADSGMGKTTLVLTEAIAMATGRNLLGPVPTPVKVLYWNGEESHTEVVRRVLAICQHYNIDAKRELTNSLFIATGDEYPLTVASAGRNGTIGGDVSALYDALHEHDIAVLIIDPFVACHLVPENDNGAINYVVKQFARIAVERFLAVELVHHTRKPMGGQAESSADDGRGASSFKAAVRSERVLNRMTEAEGQQAGVENHRNYFRAGNGKANYSAPADAATWFKLIPVILPNGDADTPADCVGVVAPWRYPGAFDNVTEAHMMKVRALAATGHYRSDAQSSDWIGHAIADVLHLDPVADVKRIKTVLKTWLANNALKVVQRKDASRHERGYVVPGDFKD